MRKRRALRGTARIRERARFAAFAPDRGNRCAAARAAPAGDVGIGRARRPGMTDSRFASACRLAADGKLLDAESLFDDFTRRLRGQIVREEELFARMREEHRAIETLIVRARAALVGGNVLAFDAAARELSSLLESR
jgi:hypothetical protein